MEALMSSDFHLQGQLFPINEGAEQVQLIMGVMEDGTPYLTMSGLARLCGLDPSTLWAFTSKWNSEDTKPRTRYIANILYSQGYDVKSIFTRKTNEHGQETHVYPDYVCMAILEYYAFEAKFDNTIARDNYRRLSSYTLRRMIYEQLGLLSDKRERSWDVYRERISLNSQIPSNYFSIFREMADLSIMLINSKFELDPHSIPDISVGILWAKYWKDNDYEGQFGDRVRHDHYYPDSFPQSAANPVSAYIYPIEALGYFRRWLMTVYVNEKLEPYLSKKVKDKAIPELEKTRIIEAITSNSKMLN